MCRSRWVWATLSLSFFGVSGCGGSEGDDEQSGGTAGTAVPCVADGVCQTLCAADPDCASSSGGASSGGSSSGGSNAGGTGGVLAAGGTGGAVDFGAIGTRCDAQGDCAPDLVCVSEMFYERPVCTRPCWTPEDCPSGSECVQDIPSYSGGSLGPYCLVPCVTQPDCDALGSECDSHGDLAAGGRFCF